jgi:hypothetical protein
MLGIIYKTCMGLQDHHGTANAIIP